MPDEVKKQDIFQLIPTPEPPQKSPRKLVIVVFLVTLGALVGISVFYFFRKSRSDTQKEDLMKLVNTGVVEADYLGEVGSNEVQGKKSFMYIKSTGKVSEQDMVDINSDQVIGKMSSVEFNLEDAEGRTVSMDVVVQITPPGSRKNIIPWYIQDAYRFKEGKTMADDALSRDAISELFEKGTIWVLELLLSSNRSEGKMRDSVYNDYVNLYYSVEDWNVLENSFNDKFVGFNFSKPVLPLSLFYLELEHSGK
jgi:hypothetical protein